MDVIRHLDVAKCSAANHPDYFYQRVTRESELVMFAKAATFFVDKEAYSRDYNRIPVCKNETSISYIGKTSFEMTTLVKHTSLTKPAVGTYRRKIVVVDPKTRRSTTLPSHFKLTNLVNTHSPIKQIHPTLPQHAFRTSRRVKEDHIDFNKHMGMMIYFYIALDCIDEAFIKGYFTVRDNWLHPSNMQLEKLDILFESEGLLHDQLTFNIWKVLRDGRTYLHVILLKHMNNIASLTMTFYNEVLNASL